MSDLKSLENFFIDMCSRSFLRHKCCGHWEISWATESKITHNLKTQSSLPLLVDPF